jgi:hypothetical protein
MTKIGGSSANSYTSQAKTENNTTQLLEQHTQKIGKVIIVGDKEEFGPLSDMARTDPNRFDGRWIACHGLQGLAEVGEDLIPAAEFAAHINKVMTPPGSRPATPVNLAMCHPEKNKHGISTACELSERLGRIMVATSEGEVDIVVRDKAKLKPVNSDAVLTHYHPERTD